MAQNSRRLPPGPWRPPTSPDASSLARVAGWITDELRTGQPHEQLRVIRSTVDQERGAELGAHFAATFVGATPAPVLAADEDDDAEVERARDATRADAAEFIRETWPSVVELRDELRAHRLAVAADWFEYVAGIRLAGALEFVRPDDFSEDMASQLGDLIRTNDHLPWLMQCLGPSTGRADDPLNIAVDMLLDGQSDERLRSVIALSPDLRNAVGYAIAQMVSPPEHCLGPEDLNRFVATVADTLRGFDRAGCPLVAEDFLHEFGLRSVGFLRELRQRPGVPPAEPEIGRLLAFDDVRAAVDAGARTTPPPPPPTTGSPIVPGSTLAGAARIPLPGDTPVSGLSQNSGAVLPVSTSSDGLMAVPRPVTPPPPPAVRVDRIDLRGLASNDPRISVVQRAAHLVNSYPDTFQFDSGGTSAMLVRGIDDASVHLVVNWLTHGWDVGIQMPVTDEMLAAWARGASGHPDSVILERLRMNAALVERFFDLWVDTLIDVDDPAGWSFNRLQSVLPSRDRLTRNGNAELWTPLLERVIANRAEFLVGLMVGRTSDRAVANWPPVLREILAQDPARAEDMAFAVVDHCLATAADVPQGVPSYYGFLSGAEAWLREDGQLGGAADVIAHDAPLVYARHLVLNEHPDPQLVAALNGSPELTESVFRAASDILYAWRTAANGPAPDGLEWVQTEALRHTTDPTELFDQAEVLYQRMGTLLHPSRGGLTTTTFQRAEETLNRCAAERPQVQRPGFDVQGWATSLRSTALATSGDPAPIVAAIAATAAEEAHSDTARQRMTEELGVAVAPLLAGVMAQQGPQNWNSEALAALAGMGVVGERVGRELARLYTRRNPPTGPPHPYARELATLVRSIARLSPPQPGMLEGAIAETTDLWARFLFDPPLKGSAAFDPQLSRDLLAEFRMIPAVRGPLLDRYVDRTVAYLRQASSRPAPRGDPADRYAAEAANSRWKPQELATIPVVRIRRLIEVLSDQSQLGQQMWIADQRDREALIERVRQRFLGAVVVNDSPDPTLAPATLVALNGARPVLTGAARQQAAPDVQ